jgi:hypothetical protein
MAQQIFHLRLEKGYLLPDPDAIRAVMDDLRNDVRENPQLAERFRQDPRAVLGERGMARPLQNEIMRESGRFEIEEAEFLDEGGPHCVSTSSCCCQTA